MKQTKRQKSYLGFFIIAGTLAVIMLILFLALVIFLLNRQFATEETSSDSLLTMSGPLAMLDTDQVDPALALASLGGFPEPEVIIEAIEKERPETALAALLLQPTLSDRESAGDFLLLAQAYVNKGEIQKAKSGYKMAGTIATLSPTMPDMVRADIFLQVAENFTALNEPILAKFFLDQAFLVATESPYLRAVHRHTLLQRLQKDYIALEERKLASQSLDLSAAPPDFTLAEDEKITLPSKETLALPQEVQEAETNRWITAQELAVYLVDRGGHASTAKVEALRQALLHEDDLKLPFYQAELDSTAQLSQKINITLAKIEWLSIKYRIAKKAFGLSIVPEWEQQADQIRSDLTKTYEQLFSLYADYTVALPEVSQIDRATEHKLRREILAGELGRYPNYPEEQRKKQLQDITDQLIVNQPELKLFIGVVTVADEEMYTLQAIE